MIELGLAAAVVGSWMGHGNLHPRTPVQWEPAACMTVVDRSVEPVVALAYTIPYEDTMVPPEEVSDSRRHQFLALCHDYPWLVETLPMWISRADVDRAAAAGLVDAADVGANEVLETSPRWQGCWRRITADDARRPISFAAAMEPVVWDTSGLPVGPQVVYGYTWEPPFNMWVRRRGVIQVVDDLELAATPPALAISTGELIVVDSEPPLIEGCVRAMAGSRLSAYFAPATGEPPVWSRFAADVPVTGESFALPLLVGQEGVGKTLAIRVEVVDPLGRRYAGHLEGTVDVLHATAPVPGESGGGGTTSAGGGGGSEAGGVSSGGDGGGSGGSSGSEDSAAAQVEDAGCGCAATVRAPTWGLLALGLMLRRRRAGSR